MKAAVNSLISVEPHKISQILLLLQSKQTTLSKEQKNDRADMQQLH